MQILPTSRHICSEVSYKNLIIHQNILPISSVLSQFFSLFLFRWKVPIRIAPIKAFLNTYELNKIPQVCSLFSFSNTCLFALVVFSVISLTIPIVALKQTLREYHDDALLKELGHGLRILKYLA